MAHFFMVEDDRFISRLYERVFTLAGHTLEVAEDGDAALAKLASMNPKPAAIMLDLNIPKKSGLELLEALHNDPALKDVPVTMLTNIEAEEDQKKAFALGAKLYLIKSQHEPQVVAEKVIALAA